MVPTLSVLLALGLGPLARAADVVVVPLDALPGPAEPPPEAPPIRALVADLDARVDVGEESRLALVWRVHVLEDGWVDLPLVGEALALEDARLDGRPLSLVRAGDGWRRLSADLPAGVHTVVVRGSVQTPAAALQLPVARGVGGRVHARAPGLAFTVADAVAGDAGRWDLRPGDALDLRWAPERPPPPRPRVITFDGAVALRGGEGGVEGGARLRYRIVDGTVSELRLRIPGGVDSLEVRGRQVARHRVEGEQVVVELEEAVSGRVELELSWRGAPPPAALGPAPVPQPLDARGDATVTLVRGDDSMLVPSPGRGLEAVPTDRVPRWGRGLVAGQPLVSYRTDTAERVSLNWQRLAWEPVDAPPTLVDEARYTVVHAAHGRVHVRAAYQVRNDRNPFLRLRLPEGWQAVGVRVAGRTAEPVRAADGRWLVPLEKSVETLDGLVAFPVELMLVGDEPAWERRGLRALETPAIDAPIAYARWEVRLPRAVQQRDVEGRATLVDAWTPRDQGVLIGRATGTTLDDDDDDEPVFEVDRARNRRGFGRAKAAAPTPEPARKKKAKASNDKAVSQEYWNRAYSAYKDNKFDEAEALLEQSLAFDSSNSSAQSLRDNVSVLQGNAELDKDQQAAANRVRELARARTGDVELAQAGKAEEAERKLRAGDLQGARAAYEELVELTEQLAAVEQAEAVDQKSRLDTYRQQVVALSNDADAFADANETGTAIVGRVSKPSEAQMTLALEAQMDAERGAGARGERVVVKDQAPARSVVLEGKKKEEAKARVEKRRSEERRGDFAQRTEIDFEDIEVSGELVKPQGALLLDRRAPAAAPAPPPPPPAEPEPAPTVLEKEFLERIPTGRSYQSAVGEVAGVVSEPGSVTIVMPESVEEEEAFDLAAGGFAFGVDGVAVGGGAAGISTQSAQGAAVSRDSIVVSDDEMDFLVDEPMDDMDGEFDERPRQAQKVPASDVQYAVASVETISGRRRPIRSVLGALDRGGRDKMGKSANQVESGGEAFPVGDPAAAAFPTGSAAPPALPTARGPQPGPAHPTDRWAPVAFPQSAATPRVDTPVRAGAADPSFPRGPHAASAWPRKPPPPPAAAFGLDVPGGITASTLSLSLPETGTGLLLEQRLLPPDEPLRLTLKYRNRR